MCGSRSALALRLFVAFATICGAVAGPCLQATAQIFVKPDDDLAGLVANSPAGTAFILLPGKHYAGDITPKDDQSFNGEPGAILSGAVPLRHFSPSGQYWKAHGPTPLALSHGACDRLAAANAEACFLREDLFVDELPQQRVEAIDQLRPGTWYQFRGTGDVLLPFDPAGHLVEISNRASAFSGPARAVSIRGLIIEQYASEAQHGAIQGSDSSGWFVADNLIHHNSGYGIRTGNSMRIESNRVIANGQMGIAGIGDNLLITLNDIEGNNTHNFDPAWEAGGTKFALTNHLLFIRNCVRDNRGPGFWTDIENRNSWIVGNWSINNAGVGIFHEISGAAIIANNVSELNGRRGDSPWSSQILVSGSVNTLVLDNVVKVARNFGNGIFIVEEGRPNSDKIIHDLPEFVSRSNLVMGNKVTFMGPSGVSGFFHSKGDESSMVRSNVFKANDITVLGGTVSRFEFGYSRVDLADAWTRGQELQSRLARKSGPRQQLPEPACPNGSGPPADVR